MKQSEENVTTSLVYAMTFYYGGTLPYQAIDETMQGKEDETLWVLLI